MRNLDILNTALADRDDAVSDHHQIMVRVGQYFRMSRIEDPLSSEAVLENMQSPLARYAAGAREMRNEYARALEQVTENIKKATGQNKPLSAVMPTKDINTLENVARDMARAANAEDLGRAVGSPTAQNLASQNLLRRILGPTGLPQSWAESTTGQTIMAPATGLYKLGGADKRIMDRLVNAGLDPQDAATLLLLRNRPDLLERLAPSVQRALPAVPAAGLLGQPYQ